MSTTELGFSAVRPVLQSWKRLTKRIYIPLTPNSPPGLVEADTVDPWTQAGKYALGWTYFCIALLVLVATTRVYHLWTDKLRQALHKHEVEQHLKEYAYSPDAEYGYANMETGRTADQLFPRGGIEKAFVLTRGQSHWSSIELVNDTLALFRWVFYRPVPELRWRKKLITAFPSLATICILLVALIFVALYCFLPQPLYWQSIRFGSPPLAIRAGMIAVAMTPWLVALSMKANLITYITGIGHDRLGVYHRWGGYLCLFLVLVHMIPFYIQPVWDDGGLAVFGKLFAGKGIIYGTGIACFVPLCVLCVASMPIIRSLAYEVFVAIHIPVAMIYLALLFWHCNNFLTSWSYLWATVAIWVLSYMIRVFNINWLKPWRHTWLVGDEAAITLIAENAIKVTIPTQMKWRPGQHAYLRLPSISMLDNHPFTISSLWSEDFPSEYGELYKDCVLVFRPFGGFTKKVLETAIEKGPLKTYRAFLDGPYGGMQRELAAFETVVLFAGGSGITAIVSQLLNLIKRMRDGKAVTTQIRVIWALKRLEAMDWFAEELRICREYAPPDTVTCQFFVTGAKREEQVAEIERMGEDDAVNASRFSETLPQQDLSSLQRPNAKQIGTATQGTEVGYFEQSLAPSEIDEHRTTYGVLSSAPRQEKANPSNASQPRHVDMMPSAPNVAHTRDASRELHIQIPHQPPASRFEFGFSSTPNEFDTNPLRSDYIGRQKLEGWSTEYGRPDLGYMLKEMATGGPEGKGFFGRRTCVFVCGPPSMRVDIANTVANLQADIWGDDSKDEIFLHTENYAI